MRFKLDENLDRRLIPLFAADGHDVATVVDEGMSGSADEDVFETSVKESRTLVTLDLDFSNPLRFPTRDSAGVVVIRVHRPLLEHVAAAITSALPRLKSGNVHGRLWIVELGRIREHAPED
jgi:predicted nuclease of predicted toxin-antitoxin system